MSADLDIPRRPPTPEQIDVASGQIRRYGHGPFHCEIEPQSHGSLALWHVVGPPQVGAQLELL